MGVLHKMKIRWEHLTVQSSTSCQGVSPTTRYWLWWYVQLSRQPHYDSHISHSRSLEVSPSVNYILRMFFYMASSKNIYMKQPPGFIDPSRPHYVCKLHKALYRFLAKSSGFFSIYFSSWFSHYVSSSLCGWHCCNQKCFIYSSWFISVICSAFDINDLGPLSYFLGL